MGHGKPIVVIEDDPDIRQLIGEILRDAGHEVVECAGAEDALVCLESVHPVLITLDLAMPSMDGLQFLRVLRQRNTTASTPVIVITAAPESLQRAALSQGHTTVAKPFHIDQLLDAVGRAISAPEAVA